MSQTCYHLHGVYQCNASYIIIHIHSKSVSSFNHDVTTSLPKSKKKKKGTLPPSKNNGSQRVTIYEGKKKSTNDSLSPFCDLIGHDVGLWVTPICNWSSEAVLALMVSTWSVKETVRQSTSLKKTMDIILFRSLKWFEIVTGWVSSTCLWKSEYRFIYK